MRGSDKKLCFSEKETHKILNDCVERITYEENDWDCNVERDAVDGQVDHVGRVEVVKMVNEIKTGKALGCTDVSLEFIAAIVEIGIQVMVEFCQ